MFWLARTKDGLLSLFIKKSDTLAKYCGRQFIDIWADYLFVKK